MINFINVSKKYANGFEALHKLNLEIATGEMVFLTGHSGAGKSTLLKLIPLIEQSTSGQIIVNGQHLDQLSKRKIPYFRRKIGFIFQEPELIETQTVYDNVALPLLVSGFVAKEIGRSVRAALDLVGLLNKEKRYPLSLSAGERHRVSIARAIVNRPPILVADEPTGNLDPDLSRDIMNLFIQLNRLQTTILIATHDLGLIVPLRHRILTLKNGTIVNDGKI
jgi:cell division transport system ATP-binding protein